MQCIWRTHSAPSQSLCLVNEKVCAHLRVCKRMHKTDNLLLKLLICCHKQWQNNSPQEPSCQSTLQLMEVICRVVSATNTHSEISLDACNVGYWQKDVLSVEIKEQTFLITAAHVVVCFLAALILSIPTSLHSLLMCEMQNIPKKIINKLTNLHSNSKILLICVSNLSRSHPCIKHAMLKVY